MRLDNTPPPRPVEPGVEDCEPARYTDRYCATCQGHGKTGPHAIDGRRVMTPCGPCDVPLLTDKPGSKERAR